MSEQSVVLGYWLSSLETWIFITVKAKKIATKIRKIMVKTTIFLLFRRLAGSYKFSQIILEGSEASSTLRISSNSISGSSGGIDFPKNVWSV